MAAVDPRKTFVQQIQRTIYVEVLHDDLQYEVYVHRAGLSGNYHHKIVLRATQYEKLGYITLELGKTEDYGQIRAQADIFQGDTGELEPKGTIQGRLADFAKIAMDILVEMGSYKLPSNNCQNFCNKFLERVGKKKEQYYTTAAKVVAGLFMGVGMFAVGLFAAVKVGQAKSSSDKKKERE